MTIQQIFNSNDQIPVILAPMAGVTDLAFREICVEHGCSFTYSEMISVKAVSYNNKKTFRLMDYSNKSKPFGIQIFGHEQQVIGDISKLISEQYADVISLIDINMGCPAPKIVNNGDGSALMKDPKLAAAIIRYAVKNSQVPVTVKFRLGWDDEHINALEFAKMAEENGASAITIHGRTRKQMYSGKANWSIIKQIKESVQIPVIGNGDITCGESAEEIIKITGCDAIMIGRAAQGNPFIFEEIKAKLEGKAYTPPTTEQKIKTAIVHARKHTQYKTQNAFPEMRKHLAWYIKGIKGCSALRNDIFKCRCLEEAEEILSRIK